MSTVVQKYGGSVLTDDRAYARAAAAIARTIASGSKVVAVVSAKGETTDLLLSNAHALTPSPDPWALDLLLATGEIASAATLALVLGGIGVRARALSPADLGIRTDGTPGAGKIIDVDPSAVKEALAEADAVVCPGFVGASAEGRWTTLGRGGSDLSAIALADALGAASCGFVKDVPGYFSADPHVVHGTVHRAEVTLAEALELSRHGCRFLQDRALEWAEKTSCVLELTALDDVRATRIAARRTTASRTFTAITHTIEGRLGTISLVGDGVVAANPGIAGRLLECLHAVHIDAVVLSKSAHRTTLAVGKDRLFQAIDRLHREFAIGEFFERAA